MGCDLIGAGQNNFALGTYLGKAGLKTVICESRLENGGRLASEEITMPGYWHNTLAYFQDNRESSPVWKELDWADGYHAEFVSPPVISVVAACRWRIDLAPSIARTAQSRASRNFRAKMPRLGARRHSRFHQLIRDYLIPYYYYAAARQRKRSCKTSTPNRREKTSNGFGNRRRARFWMSCSKTTR